MQRNDINVKMLIMQYQWTIFSVRVPVETKVRLKLLAIANKTTVSLYLHNLISREWEKESDRAITVSDDLTRSLGKQVKNLLSKINIK